MIRTTYLHIPLLIIILIDEFESFILETIGAKVGGLLHGSRVLLFLFIDDVIFILYIVASLQILVDALDTFSSDKDLK